MNDQFDITPTEAALLTLPDWKLGVIEQVITMIEMGLIARDDLAAVERETLALLKACNPGSVVRHD